MNNPIRNLPEKINLFSPNLLCAARRNFLITAILSVLLLTLSSRDPLTAQSKSRLRVTGVQVQKIWDRAKHNAFTDLIKYNERLFCAFREGKHHFKQGSNGKIRVLSSPDANSWESVALFTGEGDLRDPKLSITPDGKLMMNYFRRFNPSRYPDQHERNFVRYSDDGQSWSDPVSIGYPDRWLWRITWHNNKAYGVLYKYGLGPHGKGATLLSGKKMTELKPLVKNLRPKKDKPNETTIRFGKDGTAYSLVRRSGEKITAVFGKASPPYKKWAWADTGRYFGGPNFIRIAPGVWVAAGRMKVGGARQTVLCQLDVKKGKLYKLRALPSGGDNSYPGLVWHNGVLWISYYSSHEGKSNIYIAKVGLK